MPKLLFHLPKKNLTYVYLSHFNNRKDVFDLMLNTIEYDFIYPAKICLILKLSLILPGIKSRFFSKNKTFNHGYLKALFEKLNPKAMVTLIDNSIFFQYLDKLFHKQCNFYTIQNATRGQLLERDLGKNYPVFHSNLFCWGESEKKFYIDYGAQVLKYFFVGSLRDSIYRKKHPNFLYYKKVYDIYIPSNFRKNPHYYGKLKILMKYISNLANELNLKLVVGLRNSKKDQRGNKYKEEVIFYKQNLNCNFKLEDNDQFNFSNYLLAEKAKVSIGFNTALLKEIFGRGNKIISCNFTNFKYYDFPIKGFWTCESENYETFKKIFINIFNMDQNIYREEVKKIKTKIIGYNEKIPTYKFINDIIIENNAK